VQITDSDFRSSLYGWLRTEPVLRRKFTFLSLIPAYHLLISSGMWLVAVCY
jgi:hypothetical protein